MAIAVEVKEETLEEKKKGTAEGVAYKFRSENELTEEQLTDPDYRIKTLAIEAGLDPSKMLICSKCHHCR
jgi:hypothetical protein